MTQDIKRVVENLGFVLNKEELNRLVNGKSIDLSRTETPVAAFSSAMAAADEDMSVEQLASAGGCSGIRLKCWKKGMRKCCLYLTWPAGVCVRCEF